MEALCFDCPLQASRLRPQTIDTMVEVVRARPADENDRVAVLALPAGEALLAALEQSRPERCQILDDNLPGKRERHLKRIQALPFNSCPEMALAEQISPDEFPEFED